MTLDELMARESIRHTIASYNMAGDRLRVDDFVAVFTEDGIFEIDTGGEDAVRNVGRQRCQPGASGEVHPPSSFHLPHRDHRSRHGEVPNLLDGIHGYRAGSWRILR